jgi:hypothetical protein
LYDLLSFKNNQHTDETTTQKNHPGEITTRGEKYSYQLFEEGVFDRKLTMDYGRICPGFIFYYQEL